MIHFQRQKALGHKILLISFIAFYTRQHVNVIATDNNNENVQISDKGDYYFDLDSPNPQIAHYKKHAGTVMAKRMIIPPSDKSSNGREQKRRLVAYDLDPILPPYDNVMDSLQLMLGVDVDIEEVHVGDAITITDETSSRGLIEDSDKNSSINSASVNNAIGNHANDDNTSVSDQILEGTSELLYSSDDSEQSLGSNYSIDEEESLQDGDSEDESIVNGVNQEDEEGINNNLDEDVSKQEQNVTPDEIGIDDQEAVEIGTSFEDEMEPSVDLNEIEITEKYANDIINDENEVKQDDGEDTIDSANSEDSSASNEMDAESVEIRAENTRMNEMEEDQVDGDVSEDIENDATVLASPNDELNEALGTEESENETLIISEGQDVINDEKDFSNHNKNDLDINEEKIIDVVGEGDEMESLHDTIDKDNEKPIDDDIKDRSSVEQIEKDEEIETESESNLVSDISVEEQNVVTDENEIVESVDEEGLPDDLVEVETDASISENDKDEAQIEGENPSITSKLSDEADIDSIDSQEASNEEAPTLLTTIDIVSSTMAEQQNEVDDSSSNTVEEVEADIQIESTLGEEEDDKEPNAQTGDDILLGEELSTKHNTADPSTGENGEETHRGTIESFSAISDSLDIYEGESLLDEEAKTEDLSISEQVNDNSEEEEYTIDVEKDDSSIQEEILRHNGSIDEVETEEATTHNDDSIDDIEADEVESKRAVDVIEADNMLAGTGSETDIEDITVATEVEENEAELPKDLDESEKDGESINITDYTSVEEIETNEETTISSPQDFSEIKNEVEASTTSKDSDAKETVEEIVVDSELVGNSSSTIPNDTESDHIEIIEDDREVNNDEKIVDDSDTDVSPTPSDILASYISEDDESDQNSQDKENTLYQNDETAATYESNLDIDAADEILSSANHDFVAGLDDLHKFLENVDPPDELDPGAGGYSLEEVLKSQGIQIIKTRLNKGIQAIKSTLTKVRKRLSDIELPFDLDEKMEVIKEFVVGLEESLNEKMEEIKEFVVGLKETIAELKNKLFDNVGVESDDFESLFDQDGEGLDDEELERMLMENFSTEENIQ